MTEHIERKIQPRDSIHKNYLRNSKNNQKEQYLQMTLMMFPISYVKGKMITTISQLRS